jgi:hypothetical protein
LSDAAARAERIAELAGRGVLREGQVQRPVDDEPERLFPGQKARPKKKKPPLAPAECRIPWPPNGPMDRETNHPAEMLYAILVEDSFQILMGAAKLEGVRDAVAQLLVELAKARSAK